MHNLPDLLGGVRHLVHAAHRKVDLVHILGSREVARHGKGNQDGLVLDLRFAKIGHALLEDADDGERDAGNLEGRTDGRVFAAEARARKQLGDHGAADVSAVVLVVEEAAVGHQQVADVLVLRAHTQHQRVSKDASAKPDAFVHRDHRRRIEHPRQLRDDRRFVRARKRIAV